MLLSPVGEFVSELQTSEILEGLMKHGVFGEQKGITDPIHVTFGVKST
jgi:hypothetical protein